MHLVVRASSSVERAVARQRANLVISSMALSDISFLGESIFCIVRNLGHGSQAESTERNKRLPGPEVEDLGMREAMISHTTSNDTCVNLLAPQFCSQVRSAA